jgi:hypothetical protein
VPYWGVKAGASLRREGREPAGYKGRLLPMRRPTKPSGTDVPRRALISRPYHHRPSALATSHDPTPPPRAVGRTAGASPPPEQKLQRQAPPATAASRCRAPPYPVREHKSSPGDPLVLPHLFPDQGRHRSRPITASRATLHAQGLHCVPFLLSRVFFVNQRPICNRDKSSRGLPVKPSLK